MLSGDEFYSDEVTSGPVEPFEPQYAVWWASAGCMPDSEEPEFVGSWEECERAIVELELDVQEILAGEHNLYSFQISEWEDE